VSCLTARTWPFPTPVCLLMGKMLLIGAAGCLLQYGQERGAGRMPGLLPLGLIALVLYGPPETRWLAVFSPTLGFLNLANPALLNLTPVGGVLSFRIGGLFGKPWWAWLPSCSTLGALLWLHGRRLPVPAYDAASSAPLPFDPTQVGAEVFQDRA